MSLGKTLILLLIFAVAYLAIMPTIYAWSSFTVPPTWQSRSGASQITIQNPCTNYPVNYTVIINCTLYSPSAPNFYQGEKSFIDVKLKLSQSNILWIDMKIRGIKISVDNGVNPDTYEPTKIYADVSNHVITGLFPTYNESLPSEWDASDTIIFQEAGKVNLTISGSTLYSEGDVAYMKDFTYNVIIPNIEILSYKDNVQSTPIIPNDGSQPTPTEVPETPKVVELTDYALSFVWGILSTCGAFLLLLPSLQVLYDKLKTTPFDTNEPDKANKMFVWLAGYGIDALGISGFSGYYLTYYIFNSILDFLLFEGVLITGALVGTIIVVIINMRKEKIKKDAVLFSRPTDNNGKGNSYRNTKYEGE
jgi:hypothetical protein